MAMLRAFKRCLAWPRLSAIAVCFIFTWYASVRLRIARATALRGSLHCERAVSYTHLTLPTICSV
eukprot:14282601-Alexandrium_andersonii.AAC.1